jgi:hypothetical protein
MTLSILLLMVGEVLKTLTRRREAKPTFDFLLNHSDTTAEEL